ncbi:MAG: tRNA preQ1(34) S-adenosylmethionine ribosyltransferase-isomerase QueA [Gemmatimonadaceae bacterium 4484_173]|nr:MAG: tRNA preQ1(34) S-adenosylmethionine ribosyltransferase-isomerase QueA [Gemmatimonadaceae bacterium 4484_173]
MTKSDLMYDLPEELIAQHPPKVRGTCRLMVLNRKDRSFHEEKFSRIREYIKPEDALVLNDTRVIRARLSGKREDTGGTVEFLLLQELSPLVWKTMVRPGRQCRTGNVFHFNHSLKATVVQELGKGRAVVEFSSGGNTSELIEKSGTVPIPPYIKRLPDELDSVRYQTVFAENDGAVAAPTAGLHFTPGILQSIEDTGTSINRLTLHVGPGTFQPLRRELLAENTMEEERYSISAETLESLRRCRQKGGRIVAAGTTVTRTLESIDINSRNSLSGSTSIFIHPPYRFRNVDVLLTNFHLPGSSLISLVGSFAGLDLIMDAYTKAIESKFMFYSYGDAMLII